ncbi:succinate dehydrogenase, cytochrome b556 subunit [Nisaea acidiphila]|uniref:Succinate dehydrogenase cytochrome b556 subunit n=1 Tax=Nisaea acidiphila TaxID=1862145 RepID=A0A9J7AK56_9PROT|nr:succinate dehydrogenase, cytochrome b556 subunit [Nisaea acidiphila]UUX48051.1 succinate dehydrogenase, cytochrome b556 subunit [Nisaea acidiphila]
MSVSNRPLSPHLQIYRLPLTAITSILHRATGVALGAGTLLLVWWLMATATGGSYFEFVQGIMGSWIGLLVLFGFSFALFFHLCNGIRHLFWDAGYGFEIESADRATKLVIAASVGLTALAWILACVL